MIDTTHLTTRNKAIVAALYEAAKTTESGHVTVDHLRRKLRTTKANIDEALVELSGAFEDIEYDADEGVVMVDGGEPIELDEVVYDEPHPVEHIVPDDDSSEPEGSDDEGDESGDDDEPASRFRFPQGKKVEYEEKGGNCGDQLAEALTAYLNTSHEVPRKDGKGTKKVGGIDLHALREVAEANGIAVVKGNNPGQMRMNLSNSLRAKWRKGQDILVGGTTVRGLANYKSRKQWVLERAAGYQSETKCTAAVALAYAEANFETKAAGGEYDPTIGQFV
jgi:hypothetical protein